jgi:hypothetical protein
MRFLTPDRARLVAVAVTLFALTLSWPGERPPPAGGEPAGKGEPEAVAPPLLQGGEPASWARVRADIEHAADGVETKLEQLAWTNKGQLVLAYSLTRKEGAAIWRLREIELVQLVFSDAAGKPVGDPVPVQAVFCGGPIHRGKPAVAFLLVAVPNNAVFVRAALGASGVETEDLPIDRSRGVARTGPNRTGANLPATG